MLIFCFSFVTSRISRRRLLIGVRSPTTEICTRYAIAQRCPRFFYIGLSRKATQRSEISGVGETEGKLVHFDGAMVFMADDLLCATTALLRKRSRSGLDPVEL